MKLATFLLANWGNVLTVIAPIAGFVVLIAKKQYAILDHIVLLLVTEAEKRFGSGAGALKLAAVVDGLYQKIPGVIRFFITKKQIESLIERVLSEAKKEWARHPKTEDKNG